MKGIELSRKYYEEFGKPMLERDFADILQYIAIAFTGSGSEHYGYDDEISRDHDFEPGFNIFLPEEKIIDRRTEFLLERAYAGLPKEFCGVKRGYLSPVGGNRHGVKRTSEHFSAVVGASDGELSADAWLTIPDYALAEATNGEIWYDEYGEFSNIRKKLCTMPEDIRLKRICGNLLIMAQSGQYNFSRCIRHGEPEAAQLACNEFIISTMKIIFLLSRRFMPFYKWSFKALRELPNSKDFEGKLRVLMYYDNSQSVYVNKKIEAIEETASEIIKLLQAEKLTQATGNELEIYAYSLNDRIKDGEIRNKHILAGI